MPSRITCPAGHEWQTDAPPGSRATRPVCGLDADVPASSAAHEEPTLLVTGRPPIVDPAAFRFSRFTDGSQIEFFTGL